MAVVRTIGGEVAAPAVLPLETEMVRTYRIPQIALIVCLVCAPCTEPLAAAETGSPEEPAHQLAAKLSVSPGQVPILSGSRFTPAEPLTSIRAVQPAASAVF